MSKTIADAIAELAEKIAAKENEVNGLKRMVNTLCEADGRDPEYVDVAADAMPGVKSKTVRLRPDEFTADKLMKAMRRYLEMRKATNPDNAPAKVDDICKALQEGGYDFRGKDPLQAVSVSLGKSSHTFKRLSSGSFGLAVWYGTVRPPKTKTPGATSTANNVDDEDEDDDDLDQDQSSPSGGGDSMVDNAGNNEQPAQN